MFSREEKSNFGFTKCGRMFCEWLTIFIRFEDDGSRKIGSGSVSESDEIQRIFECEAVTASCDGQKGNDSVRRKVAGAILN